MKEEQLIIKSVIIFCIIGFIISISIYFVKQPGGFTQVYFEDYNSLPSSVDLNEAYPISFSVASFENKPTDYEILTSDNQKFYFTLNQEGDKTINISFKPQRKDLPTNYTIKLFNRLKNVEQSIYFWYGTSEIILIESPPSELTKDRPYLVKIKINNKEVGPTTYRVEINNTSILIHLNRSESITKSFYIRPSGLTRKEKSNINFFWENFNKTLTLNYGVKG